MRKFLMLALKIVVSVGLLYLAMRGIDYAALWRRLQQVEPGWIGAAVLTFLLQVLLGSLRWREVAAQCGAGLSIGSALRYSLIGGFFNQALPGSIGGDAVRVWMVGRSGAGWRVGTYSVLVDRALGLIALAVVVVCSLPWSYQLISDTSGRIGLVLVDLAALSAGFGFLLFGAIRWPWINRFFPTRHVHGCSVVANRVLWNARRGPVVAFVSLFIQVLVPVTAWCVVRAIAAPVQFSETFLLIPPIMLITMLPISIAGWGVREAAMTAAFGYAGLAQADGLVVSLLLGGVSLLVGVLGGLVWLASGEKSVDMSVPDT